jgi:hypothetical protein
LEQGNLLHFLANRFFFKNISPYWGFSKCCNGATQLNKKFYEGHTIQAIYALYASCRRNKAISAKVTGMHKPEIQIFFETANQMPVTKNQHLLIPKGNKP